MLSVIFFSRSSRAAVICGQANVLSTRNKTHEDDQGPNRQVGIDRQRIGSARSPPCSALVGLVGGCRSGVLGVGFGMSGLCTARTAHNRSSNDRDALRNHANLTSKTTSKRSRSARSLGY